MSSASNVTSESPGTPTAVGQAVEPAAGASGSGPKPGRGSSDAGLRAQGVAPKRRVEVRGKVLTGACVAVVAALVVALIVMICGQGVQTFTKDGVPFSKFLFGTAWNPTRTDADGVPYVGALPMIAGSFSVTLLSCLFALPFALGSSIFVVEVAPRFGTRIFRPVTEVLVGIPSVVFGMIGLYVIVPLIRSIVGGTGYGIMSASIVLAVMILPTVTSLSIDAIASVPESYREGSLGLGCTRWQTIVHVVLPSALPGILTAIVLGMTRAFGEALAVQMVIGSGGASVMPTSLFKAATTLTSVITMNIGNQAQGTLYYDALWSLAMVLLVMSLLFILIVRLIGRKGSVKND